MIGVGMAFMYPSLMALTVNRVDDRERPVAISSFTMFFEIGTVTGGLAARPHRPAARQAGVVRRRRRGVRVRPVAAAGPCHRARSAGDCTGGRAGVRPRPRRLRLTCGLRGGGGCPIPAGRRHGAGPGWGHCDDARSRPLLPRRAEPRSPVRRLVRHRRSDDRHLLPAELPGRDAQAGQRRVLPDRRRPPSSTATAPASAAAPTPRPARPSGTSAATSSPGRCASSSTASSTAKASAAWPAGSPTASGT